MSTFITDLDKTNPKRDVSIERSLSNSDAGITDLRVIASQLGKDAEGTGDYFDTR